MITTKKLAKIWLFFGAVIILNSIVVISAYYTLPPTPAEAEIAERGRFWGLVNLIAGIVFIGASLGVLRNRAWGKRILSIACLVYLVVISTYMVLQFLYGPFVDVSTHWPAAAIAVAIWIIIAGLLLRTTFALRSSKS